MHLNIAKIKLLMHEVNNKIIIQTTPYDSTLYWQAVAMREAVLRTPLGLTLSEEELSQDIAPAVNIVALLDNDVVATAVLNPENDRCKMRQVAVSSHLQSNGIGRKILDFLPGSRLPIR